MIRPKAPHTMQGSLVDAHTYAQENRQPVFVPTAVFADDRGWSLMNQMQGVMSPQGQVNYSVMYPGVIKAWHRHQKQTDFWITLNGNVKAGAHDPDTGESWMIVMGEKRPGTLIIPPPLWHGLATVGPESAGLLYYVTHAYNPAEPDEERLAYDGIAGYPWETEHK